MFKESVFKDKEINCSCRRELVFSGTYSLRGLYENNKKDNRNATKRKEHINITIFKMETFVENFSSKESVVIITSLKVLVKLCQKFFFVRVICHNYCKYHKNIGIFVINFKIQVKYFKIKRVITKC